MPVSIRPVNLDSDREELMQVLERNLRDLPHARRFDWLYRRNPAGPAWSWFIVEPGTGKAVGAASLYPRAVWMGREPRVCGQVGDFAVDANYRSLGPALLLQRATFEPVDRGALAFCYDCPPHEAGMSTFRRLGLKASCEMRRFARPLRINRHLNRRLGKGALATALAGLGNLALWLQSLPRRKVDGLEIAPWSGRFGEEFTRLDAEVGGAGSIRYRRRAEDLNWRYRDDPVRGYKVLAARRRGELLGYAVFSISGGDASVIDLFGKLTPQVGLSLLEAVVEDVYKDPVQTLSMLVSAENDMSPLLQKAHFHRRDRSALVVAYAPANSEARAFFDHNPQWLFQHADILA